MKQPYKIYVITVLTSLVIGFSGQSQAQTVGGPPADAPPASNLGPDNDGGAVSDFIVGGGGLGPNEISLGNGIEVLCPRLDGRGANKVVRTNDEADLNARCVELSFARINGASSSDLNNNLRQVNIDEAAAQSRGIVEYSALRTAAVAGRLQQLRVADAGRSGETLAFKSEQGRLSYQYATGGAAGDGDFGKWSVYVNGEFFGGDRSQTGLEAGFDLEGGRITVGVDNSVSDNVFIGASLDYISYSADFDNGSDLDTDGVDLTLYGTVYTDNGLYIEGTIGIGTNNYEQDRRMAYTIPALGGGTTTVNQTASSDPDGDQIFASLGVGKDITNKKGVTTNFTAHLNYLDSDIDRFQEKITGPGPGFGMTLDVRSQNIESLRSSVGAQISKAISTQSGVIAPFARADWIHEFENDGRTIIASFVNDPFPTKTTFALTTEDPDEDYFRLGGGVSAVFAGGLQGFVAVDTVLGLDDLDYYSLSAGLSKEF